MERAKSVAKTVRIDGALIDAVIKAVHDNEERDYGKLNFSEIVKNGLLLVCAAYSQPYNPANLDWRYHRSFNAASHIRKTDILKQAAEILSTTPFSDDVLDALEAEA